MELLGSPAADGAIEPDVGSIELWLAGFQDIVQALDQTSDLVAIQLPVVVVQVVELGGLVVDGFVITTFDPPNVGPVGGRGMIGSEEVVGTGDPFVEVFLD